MTSPMPDYDPSEHWDTPARWVSLGDIEQERIRQDEKWGEQNHPNFRRSWPTPEQRREQADYFRRLADGYAQKGSLTWRDILLEEVYEALAEDDPALIRAELVQVAAVAAAWIECIDRKAGK